MRCKICQSASDKAFDGTVLEKHRIEYFRCGNCGFIQTEEPYWLEESYSDAISDLDLGPVNRAITGAKIVEGLILAGLDPNASYVDWGGGYGVFTRLMRDMGYDFYWRDLYCENLFAKQFVAEAGRRYELLTAFEVIEHLVDPLAEIDKMAEFGDNLFFSTLLVPDPLPADWWYFAPEHGQHISFYTRKALEIVAARYKMHLQSDGAELHLLTRNPMSPLLFRTIASNGRAAALLRRVMRRRAGKRSLLVDDFRRVTGWTV